MPWKTIKALVHDGPPDASIGTIRLEDGTELKVVDDWSNYPVWSAILAPGHIPEEIEDIRKDVYTRVLRLYDLDFGDLDFDSVQAHVSRESLQVGAYVVVYVQHGRSRPVIRYQYDSPVVELIGSPE